MGPRETGRANDCDQSSQRVAGTEVGRQARPAGPLVTSATARRTNQAGGDTAARRHPPPATPVERAATAARAAARRGRAALVDRLVERPAIISTLSTPRSIPSINSCRARAGREAAAQSRPARSGRRPGAADPRSPGRAPSPPAALTGNPVFEVDDDWFGAAESKARADARAGRREIAEDLRDPARRRRANPAPAARSSKSTTSGLRKTTRRAPRHSEQEQLAKEMGIHDVDLTAAAAKVPPSAIQPGLRRQSRRSPRYRKFPKRLRRCSRPSAGEPQQAPAAPRKFVAPEVTDEMLDQMAARVAERLTTGAFGEH